MSSTDSPRISEIRPLWAVEGGRVSIRGSAFPVDLPTLPQVRVGALDARVVHASPTVLSLIVPEGIEGGTLAVRLVDVPGETGFLEVGWPVARDVYQVDSPVFDQAGNLYVTISARRGEEVEVPLFRVTPEGHRQPMPVGVSNATSLATDADGRLYLSSRFEGAVYRVVDDGQAELFANDLGSPCGLAFGPDGALYVGDRSGSVLRVAADRQVSQFASLPPSIAAYHLAFGPDGCLYVAVPTLSSHDGVYRITAQGRVDAVYDGFGRPQGIAFDRQGRLYVVEALAGESGVLRLQVDRPSPEPECVLSGVDLLGVAFDPRGGLIVASRQTVYRLDVPLKPLAVWPTPL